MGILDSFILKRKKSGIIYKGVFSNIFDLTGEGEIIYREDCVYKGAFKFGEPNGDGVVYVGKDEFRGKVNCMIDRNQNRSNRGSLEYSRNEIKISGEGRLICDNGSVYEGTFKSGRLIEGICKIKLKDGQVYEGKCRNYEIKLYKDNIDKSEINGQGKLINEKGEFYEGTFKSGKLIEGTCKIKLKDGLVYEGECKGKVPHGLGKIKYKDGLIEEGYFSNGNRVKNFNRVDKIKDCKNDFIKDVIYYTNGKVYEGEVKNGKPHGLGQMRYKNNRVYKGKFINGEREDNYKIYQDGSRYINNLGALEKIIMPDGSIYEGECIFKNLYPNIKPILDDNGYEVSGELCDYLPHGNGCLINQYGKKYVIGEFINGVLDGKATIIYKNNDEHTGDFKNGHLYGNDKRIFNGKEYEGEFVDGIVDGTGKLVKEHLYSYEGEFVNGMANGTGTLVRNGLYTYKGKFVNGVAKGDCIIIFENIGEYKGQFVYNDKTNKGTFIYKKGEEYEGDFFNGLPHGLGKVKYKKGEKYEGDFFNGLPHGYGKRNYIDGSIYEGEFQQGKPVFGIKILPDKKKDIVKVNNGIFKKIKSVEEREYIEVINNIKKKYDSLDIEIRSIIDFEDIELFCYDSLQDSNNYMKQNLLEKSDANRYINDIELFLHHLSQNRNNSKSYHLSKSSNNSAEQNSLDISNTNKNRGLKINNSCEDGFKNELIREVDKIIYNSLIMDDTMSFYEKKENKKLKKFSDRVRYNEISNTSDMSYFFKKAYEYALYTNVADLSKRATVYNAYITQHYCDGRPPVNHDIILTVIGAIYGPYGNLNEQKEQNIKDLLKYIDRGFYPKWGSRLEEWFSNEFKSNSDAIHFNNMLNELKYKSDEVYNLLCQNSSIPIYKLIDSSSLDVFNHNEYSNWKFI